MTLLIGGWIISVLSAVLAVGSLMAGEYISMAIFAALAVVSNPLFTMPAKPRSMIIPALIIGGLISVLASIPSVEEASSDKKTTTSDTTNEQ